MNGVKSFSGKPKVSRGAMRTSVLLRGSTTSGAEPSPTRGQDAEQPVRGRIRSRAVIGIRHSRVVTKQVCSSKTCPRAGQEAELLQVGQGQNHGSRNQGAGITAAQQRCSTSRGRGKASAKKQLPRGRRSRPSLLCFFTTALISGGADLGHSQLHSRRGCAQHPGKEAQFFHLHLETALSPPPNLLDR